MVRRVGMPGLPGRTPRRMHLARIRRPARRVRRAAAVLPECAHAHHSPGRLRRARAGPARRDAVGDAGQGRALATAQHIPLKFLLEILRQLKQNRLLVSRRGPEGGYVAGPAGGEITIADVIRAVEGPLATVRDISPADLAYEGPTESLRTVWIAVRGSLRQVLETSRCEDVMSRPAAPPRRRDGREVRRRRASLNAAQTAAARTGAARRTCTVAPSSMPSWSQRPARHLRPDRLVADGRGRPAPRSPAG